MNAHISAIVMIGVALSYIVVRALLVWRRSATPNRRDVRLNAPTAR
jgi:hypothetical protein